MSESPSPAAGGVLAAAVTVLRGGGVVAHACEGVWGLACDAFAEDAVQRIFDIKGRPADKGVIVIGADADVFEAELADLDESQRAAVAASWPGAETWIVPTSRFPSWITGGRTTVAVRVPGHAQARELARRFGGPLVSTSANVAGEPPMVEQADVERAFGARVDCVVPGAVDVPGRASRIRVATTAEVVR